MAIATFKAAVKTSGFRLLGSGFREFEWISIIRQTGLICPVMF